MNHEGREKVEAYSAPLSIGNESTVALAIIHDGNRQVIKYDPSPMEKHRFMEEAATYNVYPYYLIYSPYEVCG